MKEFIDKSVAPVAPGELHNATAEFCRMKDLRLLFGIPRGSAYNLLTDGKIRGVLLRSRGQKSGLRLIDLASVRSYIRSQMEEVSGQ